MVSNEIRTLPPVGTDNWYGVGLFVTKPPQNSATWKKPCSYSYGQTQALVSQKTASPDYAVRRVRRIRRPGSVRELVIDHPL